MDANLFDSLTPEQLAALLRGQGLADEGSMLDAQLAQLLGQSPQHIEHVSPLGAGLGGLAEAVDGIGNAFHAKALRGERKANLGKQDALMADFARLLQSPRAATPSNQPADPTAITDSWGVDLTPTASTDITPTWGLDLSSPNQPADPTMLSDTWGIDLTPAPPNQPANPAEVQDGWGVDLSTPVVSPSLADASGAMPGGVIPDMTQLPRRRSGRRPTPFTF